ncbi:MAG: ABC transporter permease subunit [Candidatus Brocadiia bacterium]
MGRDRILQICALAWDTLLQARRRWVLISLFILATLVLAFYAFAVSVERGGVDSEQLKVTFPFAHLASEMSPESFAHGMVMFVLGTNTFLGLFFFILAFAGFIPESIQKGSADLLLSKPVPRWLVISVKMVSISLIASLIASYFFFGALVIVWAKSGYFAGEMIPAFLLSILLFQPMVPLMALVGVASRSTPLAVVASIGAYIISALAFGAKRVDFSFTYEWIGGMMKGLYYGFPQLVGMQQSILAKVGEGRSSFETEPFIQSMILCAVYFALAIIIFQRKDYTS